MRHNPRMCLLDMLNSCCYAMEFASRRASAELDSDRVFRSAVERELMIVGEALSVLTRLAPGIAERITVYKRIIRYRNVLVHGYDIVDNTITWDIIQNWLPVLKAELEALLSEGGDKAC